jgi:hypothetical protein
MISNSPVIEPGGVITASLWNGTPGFVESGIPLTDNSPITLKSNGVARRQSLGLTGPAAPTKDPGACLTRRPAYAFRPRGTKDGAPVVAVLVVGLDVLNPVSVVVPKPGTSDPPPLPPVGPPLPVPPPFPVGPPWPGVPPFPPSLPPSLPPLSPPLLPPLFPPPMPGIFAGGVGAPGTTPRYISTPGGASPVVVAVVDGSGPRVVIVLNVVELSPEGPFVLPVGDMPVLWLPDWEDSVTVGFDPEDDPVGTSVIGVETPPVFVGLSVLLDPVADGESMAVVDSVFGGGLPVTPDSEVAGGVSVPPVLELSGGTSVADDVGGESVTLDPVLSGGGELVSSGVEVPLEPGPFVESPVIVDSGIPVRPVDVSDSLTGGRLVKVDATDC